MPLVMVDGAFDPLHDGHITYFEEAAKLGEVLCNIAPDEYVSGKHSLVLSQLERSYVIAALKYVQSVCTLPTEEALRKYRPEYFVKGKDWEGRLPQTDLCRELGIEVVYVDTKNSSTKILERGLDAFEEFVHSQKEPGPWSPPPGVSYALEDRRKIEGKHQALIKEVFNPTHVLDVGCGPGILVKLLLEQGIEWVEGIDKSTGFDIADTVDDFYQYDLVICREVLEHMPALKIQKAVENMCRLSSRFVYVTTRFHPRPATLLDVATEFDVDPTHITCMNKDLLRLMFVLQGMRRRADLEERMDWQNKNRVLVYEKV